MHDLVIRGGTIVDGSGLSAFSADIGIRDGRIAHIGRIEPDDCESIDASGCIVTPGFIDGHTHLDAQINWDPMMSCSSWHGVTTVVMGNCGFSIAPCRTGEQDLVVRNLERAEDISAAAMAEGIRWNWQTFAEYMVTLESLPRGINCAANIGHSALRTWVMGERAFSEEANETDIAAMRAEVRDALRSGAIGFTTSRTRNHETSDDRPVASRLAAWSEVQALVGVLGEEGVGIFELALEDEMRGRDSALREDSMDRMRELALTTGVPITFGLTLATVQDFSQIDDIIEHVEGVVQSGGRMFVQSHCKGVTILLSFETVLPFDNLPVWKEFRKMPLAEQARQLRDPNMRRRLVKASDEASYGGERGGAAGFLSAAPDWTRIRVYDSELPPYKTVDELSKELNLHPVEVMIELALKADLKLFFIQFLHGDGPTEALKILRHPLAVMTFSDSGAHVSQIADSSLHSHFLAYWVNRAQVFTIEQAIQMITLAPARAWGFADRGLLREGMAADINIIDLDMLMPQIPEVVDDLPGGARRLIQRCDGIRATIVNGEVVLEDGRHTGALPGKLLRGPLALIR